MAIVYQFYTVMIPYTRKFPRYVNFADFAVTYWYSENLICENLLVCNNWRFVTVHNMLPFHDEPVIRKNIIAKILFACCSAKISYRENFRVYGIVKQKTPTWSSEFFYALEHFILKERSFHKLSFHVCYTLIIWHAISTVCWICLLHTFLHFSSFIHLGSFSVHNIDGA